VTIVEQCVSDVPIRKLLWPSLPPWIREFVLAKAADSGGGAHRLGTLRASLEFSKAQASQFGVTACAKIWKNKQQKTSYDWAS
jgi:hypothetical protein